MSTIERAGVGAGWARVRPGQRSAPHQHDETELFVIVRGTGEVSVGGRSHPVEPGTVLVFEPFDTHVIENTGDVDLVFTTFYWRDPARAVEVARGAAEADSGERPVFVFSTPPTPNGDLHLGHLSGPYLGADVMVRFLRMTGVEAWHLTGSDDYQSYVVEAARRRGETPAETAAHFSAEIAATLALMDIEPDQYTVTSTEPGYPDAVREYFSRITASGRVRIADGPALFDHDSGRYLYEVDVTGRCPGCDSPTGGNICEECGEPNSCADLVDPRSGHSSAPPTAGTAARVMLPLHEFRAVVAEHQRVGRVPVRLRELAERVLGRERLDVALTHPADWGVAPSDALTDRQVIWVWPEMAFGFRYGIEALGRRLGQDWSAQDPAPDWQLVHFFGYDNSFYHSLLYPVLYHLAYPQWRPEIDYHVNEFYLLEGAKFSTSRGHAVWGKEVLRPDTVDAVRFHLALTRPEGRRTDFRAASYRHTAESVLRDTWQHWLNDLGRRVEARYDGVTPDAGVWSAEHIAFLARLDRRRDEVAAALGREGFSLNAAAAALAGLVEDAARFHETERATADAATWADEARTAVALELAAARLLARCAAPVMPRFAARLAGALGDEAPVRWPRTVELVKPGTRIALADQEFFTPATPAGEQA